MLDARARAEADGVVTSVELRELAKAAKNLGTGHAIQDLLHIAEREKERKNGPLKGWRIVPLGESAAISAVMEHATAQGAVAGVNVSKTVRLVIAEEGSDDPRVQRARESGHRVLTPAQAWDVLKEASYRADGNLFEDSGSVEAARGLNAGQRQQNEERSDWLTTWRPRELTDREYHREFMASREQRDRAARGGSRADRDPQRITATFPAEAQKKSGGCAGAVLLFMATGATVTAAVSELLPF